MLMLTMTAVGLKRFLERVMNKKNRSPLEYVTLSVLALLVGAILKYPNRAIGTHDRPDLKGERGLPLIGNLISFIRSGRDPLGYRLEAFRKYGPVNTLTVPIFGRFIFVNTPEHMQYLLKDNFENYIKGSTFQRRLIDLLGRGIFIVNGTQWKIHRKTASNIFTTRLYRDLVQGAFKATAADLSDALDKTVDRGTYIDLQNEFLKLTLDAFGRLTFGLDFQALKTEGHNEFGDAYDYMTNHIESRATNPFWRLTEMLRPGKRREIRTAIATVDRYAMKAIEARRAETPEQSESRPRDLLDHFIKYQYEDGSMLTDVELRDVFVNFMIAGRDTTAQTLSWMFYMLMIHPDVLAKLREEMDIVFPGGSSDNFKYETFANELPYSKAVFYETVRLYPAVPKNAKYVVEDDVLPCGTPVHKGDLVGFSNYCMARNTDVWGPDAAVYRPERWLDMPSPETVAGANVDASAQKANKSPFGKFRNESTFKFPNFNAGPRICLGQTFATLEALVTTVYLLQRFDFHMAPNQPTPVPKPAVTMPMRDPFMVGVTRRQRDATALVDV
ncbi:hypothetical protein DFQ26_006469 [Actinomortierella ambigua]|nr:hypothetical protein DFQ26_006469 [Actinomortierella ambigua]